MGCRSLLTAAALLAALGFTPAQVLAQGANSGRVLAQTTGGFNPSSVQSLIDKGDAAAAAGDLTTARKAYDDARKAAKQLLAFYRDLSGAFRGLTVRVSDTSNEAQPSPRPPYLFDTNPRKPPYSY